MSLSYAAANGYKAVIKYLLAIGIADVDLKDDRGRTPLSWASGNGHMAVVNQLLETGKVNVDTQDTEFDRTPLL
jgi:ankyrin repeat protein